MDLLLDSVEVRVLGSLVEKQTTTPEYYPLSLNALTHACNQKSSRDPVVSYDERTVTQALDSLRDKKLVWLFRGVDSRVPKYGHIFPEAFDLTNKEVAVMCVLMLRGPQTVGEVRGRTSALYNFESLGDVEATLEGLIEREGQNLVMKLPRLVGMKESRYAHLLSGPIAVEEIEVALRTETRTGKSQALEERVNSLQEEVARLREQLSGLEQQFSDFKKQFE
ncbi:MAG TPA: YceH family protein [Blastocatellia bacterium]|nr:YceH family protein [Blastocatellia bacterium]